jgi:hypothetical protein
VKDGEAGHRGAAREVLGRIPVSLK